MIEIKADGPSETRLLELLYPAPSALPAQSSSALVTAEVQQRIDNLTYLVQTQQQRLEQAQSAIDDYQQTFAALTGSQTQALLSPAVPSNGDSDSAAPVVSRRYITGGLGQGHDAAIPVGSQTAQTEAAVKWQANPPRWHLSSLSAGLPRRLTKASLILALSALTSWGVFKYAAPSIGSWLFPEPTASTSEPTEALEQEKAPEPESNLSEESPPGSAANKAGTLPPIPTAPPPALEP